MNNMTKEILEKVYLERREKKPSYSLRAFARDLAISAGGLHHVLSGTKKLSFKRAVDIARRLKLNKKQTEQLMLSVQLGKIDDPEYKEILLKAHGHTDVIQRDLSIDLFRILTDWYYLPIYEACELEGFQWNSRHIAHRFKISSVEASQAMERLERLELVKVSKNGRAEKQANHLLVESQIPNETIRKHYRSLLQKASEAIDNQTPDEKIVGTEVMSFDTDDLQKVKTLTEEYFTELLKISAKGKSKTEVYVSFVEFFRVSQLQNKS
ncbi:MAG: TIGR02147 family protein [Bdellovibrionales bacterium]